jgi:hypothetical protein
VAKRKEARMASKPSPSLAEHRMQRDKVVETLLSQVDGLTRLLHDLSGTQRGAVVALVGAAQAMTAYERSENNPSPHLIKRFASAMMGLSPNIAATVGAGGFPRACLTESIAYASSMARCLGDKKTKKTQAQCEIESAPEGAAEIFCMIKALEALIKSIRPIIPGPIPGPGPGPGPVAV